jgi:hypothetical protein
VTTPINTQACSASVAATAMRRQDAGGSNNSMIARRKEAFYRGLAACRLAGGDRAV